MAAGGFWCYFLKMEPKNVPVFILAGGMGTRISEETSVRPKPMIEVGDIPILLHLMRYYYSWGFNDFVICAGYRAWDIKQYFLDYEFRPNHLQIDHRADTAAGPRPFGKSAAQERWRVRVIDTGLETMTGARVARAFDLVQAAEPFENFAVTYGDGLADVDLGAELAFHEKHGKLGTMLGVRPTARFGELEVGADGRVSSFLEKPEFKQSLVNGGYLMFRKEFRGYLSTESSCVLERAPLAKLASDQQLMMFRHEGFWKPMDTLRDKIELQAVWDSGKAPWLRTAEAR